MLKRILSVILITTFLISLMPLAVLAVDTVNTPIIGGNGGETTSAVYSTASSTNTNSTLAPCLFTMDGNEFIWIGPRYGTVQYNGNTLSTYPRYEWDPHPDPAFCNVNGNVGNTGMVRNLAIWRNNGGPGGDYLYWIGFIFDDPLRYWGHYVGTNLEQNGIKPIYRDVYANENGTSGVYVGDPIDPSSGAHAIDQPLLMLNGVRPLTLSMHYNSLDIINSTLGKGWYHDYDKTLKDYGNGILILDWSPISNHCFTSSDGTNYTCPDRAFQHDRIVKQSDGSYILARRDQSSYIFDSTGRFAKQKNCYGQELISNYDSKNRLSSVVEPVSGKLISFEYNTVGDVYRVTDSANRQISFVYNNELIQNFTDANGKTSTFTYNSGGQVLTETDGDNKLVFSDTYDEQGRVETQDDGRSDNQLMQFNYDESIPGTLVTTVTDRNGQTSIYTFNDKYELLHYRDPNGNTSSYTYDAQGNRNSSTDPLGNTVNMHYDSMCNLDTLTNPLGKTTSMTYDGHNNLKTITNTKGKVTSYDYDDQNHLISITNPLGHVSSMQYIDGYLMSTTSPRGGRAAYTYVYGLPETVTDPTGRTLTYGYDGAGRVKTITNALGKTISMDYDPIGNLLNATNPLGLTRSFTYDASNKVLTETDPKGNVYTYQYDGNENLKSMLNPAEKETIYEYDGEDRLEKITDARGNATSLAYDPKGRLMTTTDAIGNITGLRYDTADYLKGRTDAFNTQVLDISYDAAHNPLTMTDALGNVVVNQYNDLGVMKQQTDPMGHITQYGYDDLNRLVNSTNETGGIASIGFDDDGNVNSGQDLNQNITTRDYDLAGRILSSTLASGAATAYHYNEIGLLDRVTNGRGQTTTYQYYDDGTLQTRSDPAGTISYTYDENGNVLTIGDSTGTTIREYDNLNRVKRYTDARGNLIQYDYDDVGNLTLLTYPGGKQVQYQYDTCDRLKQVIDWNDRITAYDYDANSRLKTTTRPDGSVESRRYDTAGLLKQIKDVDKDYNIIAQFDFEYDAAGKITVERRTIPNQPFTIADRDMTYGPDNRLATYNGQNAAYDTDGNMTRGPLNGQMVDYTYDCRNRLTVVGSTYYQYDAENQRIGVNENGQQTDYVISPTVLSQTLIKTAPDGTKTFYVYGLGLLGQENPDGSYQTYHFDLRGSTVAITGSNRAITDRFQYGPYGELVYRQGTTSTSFLYNGRDGVMTDSNGLYYMRARYYNQEILRFINQDVLLGSVSSSQTLNRYAYVNGEPVSFVDPFGLERQGDFPEWHYWIPFYGLGLGIGEAIVHSPLSLDDYSSAQREMNYWHFCNGGTSSIMTVSGFELLNFARFGLAYYGIGTGAWRFASNPATQQAEMNAAQEAGNLGANSAVNAASLRSFYQQAEKYGAGGIRELSDGRIRFYGEITPAAKEGEMAGARLVREWNPVTDARRTWYETLDHAGNIRQVRPDPSLTGGEKIHYMFDAVGDYIGSWTK